MSSEEERERPICRICFITTNNKLNPLISPCDCKGSMAFVHIACLIRWIRMNPSNNNQNCELCLVPYVILHHPSLEVIPLETNTIVFLLRFPFLMSIALHYIWIYHASYLHPMRGRVVYYEQLYLIYQWIFQILYFVMFLRQSYIKNPDLYRQEWKKTSSVLYILFYGCLLTSLHSGILVTGPLLNIYMCGIWNIHVNALRSVNKKLLVEDN